SPANRSVRPRPSSASTMAPSASSSTSSRPTRIGYWTVGSIAIVPRSVGRLHALSSVVRPMTVRRRGASVMAIETPRDLLGDITEVRHATTTTRDHVHGRGGAHGPGLGTGDRD